VNKLVEKVLETGIAELRYCVAAHKDFTAMAILAGVHPQIIEIPWKDDDKEKAICMTRVGTEMVRNLCTQVAVVADAWFMMFDQKTEQGRAEAREVLDNPELNRPSMQAKSMRKSALTIHWLDIESRTEAICIQPYTTTEGEVVLGEVQYQEGPIKDENVSGNMKASLIQGLIQGIAERKAREAGSKG
jgi:hypothetical protein